MDPFRDELHAAHEKIAQLEKELHELRTIVDPYIKPRKPRDVVLFVVACMAALGVGFVAGQAGEQSAERERRLESQPGIAIAPTARSTMPLAAASFGPPSPALDKQDPYKGDKKCNCSPGDPLCSCL